MKEERAPGRVACLLVPELLAAAQIRAEPELAEHAFGVTSERGSRAVLLSVSPEARRRGVYAGASLSHARAVCGDLVVRVAQPALERAARAALLDVALSASPRAEVETESGAVAAVVLDATGLGRIFTSETALTSALVERARAQGLPAVAAIAATRALALVAARDAVHDGAGTVRIVAPGDETRFLAPLSVDLLAPSDATAELLTRFGIYRLGALLALPPATVATRLGAALSESLARLRGARREPRIPAPRVLRIEESLSLEAPLADAEPFLFVLGNVLSRVFARLALRHLACGTLEIELDLDAATGESGGAGRHALRLSLAAPSADVRTWLRRVRLALERDPPRALVSGLSVATEGHPARRDQLDLFRPAGPAPAALDALLAELELLCGEGRVGAPRIPDDPHPDAITTVPFTQLANAPLPRRATSEGPASGAAEGGAARSASTRAASAFTGLGASRSEAPANEAHQARRTGNPFGSPGSMPLDPNPATHPDRSQPPPSLALRILRPPLAAQVQLRAGQPASLRSAIANGEVLRCAGPWRATGGWWTETGRFAFDSYDVATSDGLIVRLRRDLGRDRWQIDAIYD